MSQGPPRMMSTVGVDIRNDVHTHQECDLLFMQGTDLQPHTSHAHVQAVFIRSFRLEAPGHGTGEADLCDSAAPLR